MNSWQQELSWSWCWGWGWGWSCRCPFTGTVVTHSQGHGRGRGWIIMTLQQFQHATCSSRELRRRATVTVTATVPKWQCNMIALGLATCHIYHSSKRWKISHSFILHPNAESCLPAAQKPVRRPEQILLALLATTCHILGDQSEPDSTVDSCQRCCCPSSPCNNMQMTLLIFMNFSDYENCFWAFGRTREAPWRWVAAAVVVRQARMMHRASSLVDAAPMSHTH